MPDSQHNWFLWLIEKVLPWLTLGFLVLYIGIYFFYAPYVGFTFNTYTGNVDLVYVTPPNENLLQVGDKIIQVGDTLRETYAQQSNRILFEKLPVGTTIPIILERDGERFEISWLYQKPSATEIIERINNFWWLPIIFWVAGLSIIFLVRPKNTRWYLLLLFNFLTAIWLATGLLGQWHLMGSIFVQTFILWLCVPIYFHLHWVFPYERKAFPAHFLRLLYIMAVICTVAEWLQWIPMNTGQIGLLFAILMSLIVLFVGIIRNPDQRTVTFPIVLGLSIIFLPIFLVLMIRASGIFLPNYVAGGSLLGLAALPGIYFYTIYRLQYGKLTSRMGRWYTLYLVFVALTAIFFIIFAVVFDQLSLYTQTLGIGVGVISLSILIMLVGVIPFISLPALVGAYSNNRDQPDNGLELRVNHLLTPFLFFLLLGTAVFGVCILLMASFQLSNEAVPWLLLVAMTTSILVYIGYQPFSHFIEHRLFGIVHAPTHLLPLYADQITQSYRRDNLSNLLSNEVFPSLSIRQSALLFFDENQPVQEICLVGVSTTQLPTKEELINLVTSKETPEKMRDQENWIQHALPLNFDNDLIGVWLFGRRDPDDLYSKDDIRILQALANQTATALMNIIHRDKLHHLYRHNINVHEQERLRLSRILHDDILNGMTALGLYTDKQAASEFREIYKSITTQIKQASRGLRPAMLNYGLWSAIDELTVNLHEQFAHAEILLNVLPSDCRYPSNVELHIFRIVQEALRNIFKHTQAESIYINGALTEHAIYLAITDDGQGFPINNISLEYLLQHNHFGLAGIFERAEIIGAQLHIESITNEGTTITITWQENNKPQT